MTTGAIIDVGKLINALGEYRARLLQRGQPLKAVAVAHCIVIIRQLSASLS